MTVALETPAYRIGVDVGGTNTDAAILDLRPGASKPIIGVAKSPTTPDVSHGIHNAIDSALLNSHVSRSDVESVVIGTTSFVNSLVERDVSRLERVAVIRLCGVFTRLAPPFISFPYALRRILEGPVHFANGGLQVDGSEIAPVDPEEIKRICEELKGQGTTAIVISACYSPIDQELKQEEQVRDIAQAILPDARITLSKEVAHIGLLQRENAAILNAALRAYAERTVAGLQRSTASLQLDCPLWLTSNDGTLMTCGQAAQYPIRTFSSGPTNSMRGASFLANLEKGACKEKETALVIDVGGTTTEIGVLLPSGFPRQAAATHELCGVSLNFAMPHVHSIGLGGGSKVRSSSDGSVTIGPDSVAYRLDPEAICFGGSTTTTTDIMVAAGRAKIGPRPVSLDTALLGNAQAKIKAMIEVAIDTMKTSSADIPVYLVGGGAFLVPSDLRGVSTVHRFPFSDAANAVGAACAQVAGTIDTYEDTSSRTVGEVQKEVEARAIAKAVAQGADADQTVIVESECIPIAYTTGRARFCVKAAGPWSAGTDEAATRDEWAHDDDIALKAAYRGPEGVAKSSNGFSPISEDATDEALDSAAINAYKPKVQGGAWILSEPDVEWIATGCYILGTGGGGNPETIYLAIREQIRAGAQIKVIDAESMDPDSVAGWGGGIGSPEVGAERLVGGDPSEAISALIKFCQSPKLGGLVAVEIGGGNGIINMLAGASTFLDAPILDGDFMGRAYPTGWQVTPNVYDEGDKGANLLPNAMASGDGNVMFMTQAKHYKDVDKILRAGCIEMGTAAAVAGRPFTKAEISRFLIRNTVSQAWRLGRAVALARCQADIGRIGPILVDALGGDKTAKMLFAGKIVSVGRRLHKGHSLGEIEIHPINSDEVEDKSQQRFTGIMKIPFMNENLLCEHVVDGTSKIVAGVPDLICVLDAQNGSALGTPEYKYGQRVLVLGTVGAPQWTDSERGLALGSLQAFGYDVPYEPLGVYVKPRSVIEEYGNAR